MTAAAQSVDGGVELATTPWRSGTTGWLVLADRDTPLRDSSFTYGPMSIGGIVETTLMEQPTTSRVVAQLEREGHVGRRLSDRDSRVAEIG